MLFNSFDFITFFIVIWGFYLVLERRAQNILLLAASLFFYGYWDLQFLGLLVLSMVVDYFCAYKIEQLKQNSQKSGFFTNPLTYLKCSVIFSVGLLGTFKYFNFFIDQFKSLFPHIPFSDSFSALHLVIPVGMSFYTFQSISYVIDVYRGKISASKSFFDFSLYVSFFPQLLAGPIERAGDLLPQIQNERHLNREMILNGFGLLAFGYFQKVVVADNLYPFVSLAYDTPRITNSTVATLSMYAGVLQIYCDFAGYSNIARGLASLLGFQLSVNFYNPYFSKNPKEVWQRWHITLTRWFADYVFRPLADYFRRRHWGPSGLALALVLTTTLIGIWHGAKWGFLLWGLSHGLIYLVYHWVQKRRYQIRFQIPTFLTILAWFHIWGALGHFNVIRKVSDLKIHWQSFRQGFQWAGLELGLTLLVFAGILFIFEWLHERNEETFFFSKRSPLFRLCALFILLILIITCGVNGDQPFVYFQF